MEREADAARQGIEGIQGRMSSRRVKVGLRVTRRSRRFSGEGREEELGMGLDLVVGEEGRKEATMDREEKVGDGIWRV